MTITASMVAELQPQLELARQVQLSLLPKRHSCLSGWEVAFSYEPAGFLSGGRVDLIPSGSEAFYFALGDVSGKGAALLQAKDLSSPEILDAINRDIVRYTNGAKPGDDCTMLALRPLSRGI